MTTREPTAPNLGMGIDLSLEQRHPYREGRNEYERVESHRVDALDQIAVLNNPEAECEERQTALVCVGETGLSIGMTNLLRDIGYTQYQIVNKDYKDASARVFEREIDGRIEVLVQTYSKEKEDKEDSGKKENRKELLEYYCFENTPSRKVERTLTSRLDDCPLSARGITKNASKTLALTASWMVASVASGMLGSATLMYLADTTLAFVSPLLGIEPVPQIPSHIIQMLITFGGIAGFPVCVAIGTRTLEKYLDSVNNQNNKFLEEHNYKQGFEALEAALKRPDEQKLLAESTDVDD